MCKDGSKKKMCLLVGSSEFYCDRLSNIEDAFIIALDGGYEHLRDRGIVPDMIIGDFDSLGYIPEFDDITVLPRVKDDTDSFYAAKEALGMGYRDFYLCGCTGGERPEHTFANISLMLYLSHHGAKCVMEGERELYRVISGPCKLEFFDGQGYFSAFSLSESTEGVTMHGFEYETRSITMRSDVPLGVSNSFKNEICTLEISKGDLLVIWEK